ncbi:MAG: agmatine deiminase family protein [Runella sp.]
MKLSLVLLWLLGFLVACQKPQSDSQNDYYTQADSPRTAAEWEPAIGTMIVWPLCVPYKLAVELAKDNHLYTLVANDSARIEAQQWYVKWGIDLSKVTFIAAPQGLDAWWTRDWGPSAVFLPDGTMKLGDGRYPYSTPNTKMGCEDTLEFIYTDKNKIIIKTETDDNATASLGKGLRIEVLDLPYITTGGNVLTDGLGTAFSSCILLNENKFYGVSKEDFFRLNKKLAGLSNYHILSNFEKWGIQHLDCFMKLLDEERILVAQPPTDHELYPVYENIVENELKKLKNVYGRPYQIIRIKTGRYEKEHLAAYTNSIIVNQTVYVPLFQIKEDEQALQTWQNALPGYTVKGFTFALKDEPTVSKALKEHYKSGYGWTYGDALHCRTRAVWDSQMLYITLKRLPAKMPSDKPLKVYASIIDYSKKGLIANATKLYWRTKGESDWQIEILKPTNDDKTHFEATIPAKPTQKAIEYYIAAASSSGRSETMPRTAPRGFYEVIREE